MTAIDTAKTLITSRIASGAPGSITAPKLQSTLLALADAVATDRVPANIPTSVSSPLSGADLGAVLTNLATLLDALAPKASPALTGTPTAPTAASEVSSTQIATTAFVHNLVNAIVNAAPGALDTLDELAAALGDDANFAATVTNALAGKLPLTGGTLSGPLVLDDDPAVALEAAPKQYVDAQVATVSAAGDSGIKNIWINGALEIWQRGTTSLSSPAGSRTFLADRVYVNPAGAAVTQERSTTIPTGAQARYSLQVNGAASVTTVLIGQRIEAAEIPAIKRAITITAKIYNGSGANFTPNLLLGTPSAEDNFTTVTNRLTQALQECADSAWTTVTHTVNISGYTNIDNGLQVEFQIPSGSLVASDVVRITEISVGLNTTFAPTPTNIERIRCWRYYVQVNNSNPTGFYIAVATSGVYYPVFFPVPMRATPTGRFFSRTGVVGTISGWVAASYSDVASSPSVIDKDHLVFQFTGTNINGIASLTYDASAEL